MRRYDIAEFQSVMALIECGLSDSEIAQRTGVGRRSVNGWRHGRGVSYHLRVSRATPAWRPRAPAAYAYLLGVYLGDGWITVKSKRAASLVFTLDAAYPGIVEAVILALDAVFPGVPATRHGRMRGSVTAVQLSDPALAHAFPQHGRGRKHLRTIELTPWQRKVTHAQPQHLLRGLIHSDGCRCVNRFETTLPSGRRVRYEYPRYFFSNLSEDIRDIFCEHCDMLGVRWTQSSARNISVANRASVAALDQFVGPKR